MRILLSTIGSRGDVQPLVALGLQLKALGQEVRLCVPPDFREWIEGLDLPVTPIGPSVRAFATGGAPAAPPPITPELRRQMVEGTVATQFETIAAAAAGCDAVVGATALQVAAPSVAGMLGIPYVFAAYCPRVLPSRHHPPIPLPTQAPAPPGADNVDLWARDAEGWNETWGPAINSRRAAAGLAPVDDVRGYVLTNRPWLAADPTLGPWPDPADGAVVQAGAWILPDARPLSSDLERFLDAGDPPIYFGFGSSRATPDLGRAMVEAARTLGRRAIVSRGWADDPLVAEAPDCLEIGEVNVLALFARVAAVVHHGGAGTTAAAALSGAPQVVLPQRYDQPYWARRVGELGIGEAHAPGAPTAESFAGALARALRPEVVARVRSVAALVRRDGARGAAERLIATARNGRAAFGPADSNSLDH
jgi:vancomycin aglycone glucosyltransferase